MKYTRQELIAECHRNLQLLRQAWFQAPTDRKDFWMRRINRGLKELSQFTAGPTRSR